MAVYETRGAWGADQGGGGGLAVGGLRIDRALTIPAAYERHGDVIRLRHWTDFGFLATNYDALAVPPLDYVAFNTGSSVASVVGNVAGSGRLDMTAQNVAGGQANWWGGVHSAYQLLRRGTFLAGDRLIGRMKIGYSGTATNQESLGLMILGPSGSGTLPSPYVLPSNNCARAVLGYTSTAGGKHVVRAMLDGGHTTYYDTHDAGITQATLEASIWMMIEFEGRELSWHYELTNSAIRPDDRGAQWTRFDRDDVPPWRPSHPLLIGFGSENYNNAAGDHVSSILHFEMLQAAIPGRKPFTNCGTSTGNQDITLIASAAIGAATLSDADLRAALVAATNTRSGDTADVKFSAARAASAATPAAGAYNSAATATVSGAGENFGLFMRTVGDGTQPGGIRDGLYIPVSA